MDIANVEADGLPLPKSVEIWFHHYSRNGTWKDNEIVAIWKRGRIVWRDSVFVPNPKPHEENKRANQQPEKRKATQ